MIVPGDRVQVVHPDPDHFIARMLAEKDRVYKVVSTTEKGVYIEARLFGIAMPAYLARTDIIKTNRKPWWEEEDASTY